MMKQETFRRELTRMTPDVPEIFHQRMESALAQAIQQEPLRKPVFRFRWALAIALIALLLSAAAIAATHWGIFDVLGLILGTQPPTADSVMQSSLHQETVNGVEITVREAGYDGRTLLLQYSYRIPELTEPLGQTLPETGATRWLDIEDCEELLMEHGVGWWIDHFWVNGRCMDMASNSGAEVHGSENPGEIVHTEYWRLDQIGVALEGTVEIALPIGQRQPLEAYSFLAHPERYDESGMLLKPEKGLVSFTFDAGDALSHVVSLEPVPETLLPDAAVQVTEAALTPLMTYITLSIRPNDGYDPESWLCSLELVDGNGKLLFPDHWGLNGYTADWAEFTYPYLDAEALPDRLWLAPMEDGSAHMALAVRVK